MSQRGTVWSKEFTLGGWAPAASTSRLGSQDLGLGVGRIGVRVRVDDMACGFTSLGTSATGRVLHVAAGGADTRLVVGVLLPSPDSVVSGGSRVWFSPIGRGSFNVVSSWAFFPFLEFLVVGALLVFLGQILH